MIMDDIKTIKGKSLKDFKDSYTLRYFIESTVTEFWALDNEGKKRQIKALDKDFSEKFNMPTANIIFKSNEHTLETDNIYLGELNDINTGLEFILRYLFEKRQQYQRLCVVKDNNGSFSEKDFKQLKSTFELAPISKKSQYIPYSKGLKKYLSNYNKVDAVEFMVQEFVVCLEMMDIRRIAKSLNIMQTLKLSANINVIQRKVDKLEKSIDKKIADKILKDKERLFMEYLGESLDAIANGDCVDKKTVFLCFHENIWENLNSFEKRRAVEITNELICEILKCKKKEIRYNYDLNSYDFRRNQYLSVGGIESSASSILQKIIYEYSFDKNYENILNLDEEYKTQMLKEFDECEKMIMLDGDYGKIRNYEFIRCVSKTAKDIQEKIYKYIDSNLIIGKEKIKMPMSKSEFILDLYKSSISRR